MLIAAVDELATGTGDVIGYLLRLPELPGQGPLAGFYLASDTAHLVIYFIYFLLNIITDPDIII